MPFEGAPVFVERYAGRSGGEGHGKVGRGSSNNKK